MELIDAEALLNFLQTTKDTLRGQALNCLDPVVSVKIYAMVDTVDLIMEKILEGPFDLETPDDRELN